MPFFDDLDFAMVEEFEREFQSGKVRKGICELEDGYYTGYIDSFSVAALSSGAPALKIVFVILTPESYANNLAIKWIMINLDKKALTVRRIKTDLMTLGFEWAGLRSLENEEKCAAMRGLVVAFKVTHKKNPLPLGHPNRKKDKFQNIWISRLVGRMTEEEMQNFR